MSTVQSHRLTGSETVARAYRQDFQTVQALFKGVSGEPVDVTSPTVTIASLVDGVTRVSGAAMAALTPPQTGTFEYVMDSVGWTPGLYQIDFTGLDGTTTIAFSAKTYLQEVPVEEEFIRMVRSRLKDFEPTLYKLDLPLHKWSEDEIYLALLTTLNEINIAGPMQTAYTFTTVVPFSLLIVGAVISCLESAIILEAWNTYTHSDGSANITINRAGQLASLASTLRANWQKQLDTFKRSMRPTPIGQGTALFPFNIRRAIGFLPNMKNIFAST
jgi:hypothetical protein